MTLYSWVGGACFQSLRQTKALIVRRTIFSGSSHNNMSETLIGGTSTAKQRSQPPWSPQVGSDGSPQLVLLNSFTRQKEKFVPTTGKQVSWYICGPTVYDASHMGHARTYVAFDIVRRVLQSYFGYNICYVMNVTDVDDKIIKRSRQRHLLDEYASRLSGCSLSQLYKDVVTAAEYFEQRIAVETNLDKKQMMSGQLAKIRLHLDQVEKGLKNDGDHEQQKEALFVAAQDIFSDWLDSQQGAKLSDHSIFMKLARKFEEHYFHDMKSLNVLPPTVLTRVSEYVPEIIAFIERIIANGFAYEANGSIYFDTQAFSTNPNHFYAKLIPEAFCDSAESNAAMREGEGELTSEDRVREKRFQFDFALWKASKPGEPVWDSPWGKGRPGWHIECSAMANEICGERLDIHSGGFDLKFPHHDNEVAQSEAYIGKSAWVNYFLHAGTLRIAGLKMSKSLKNFITIEQALKDYSSRQIRILFLLHRWSDVLDYSATTMARALSFEKNVNEFFLHTKHLLRTHFRAEQSASYVKFGPTELALWGQFEHARGAIHAALCDSIDTAAVMECVRELISHSNVYISDCETQHKLPNCLLLREIAIFITKLFKTFGISDSEGEVGWGEKGGSEIDTEELLMPYLKVLADFRESVRQVAKASKSIAVLDACDKLRDETLPELGVRLEDKEDHTVVKIVGREALMREKEQREKLEADKRTELERKKADTAAKEAKKSMPPSDLFKAQTDKFSKFDERGIPTHDFNGEVLSKASRKKLEKQYELQDKAYKAAMAKAGVAQNGDA